jgi:hypothetical protein
MNNKLYTVYSVQIRETGDILGIFDCEEDAMEEIERQEQEDTDNNEYQDKYYSVYEHEVDLSDGKLLDKD